MGIRRKCYELLRGSGAAKVSAERRPSCHASTAANTRNAETKSPKLIISESREASRARPVFPATAIHANFGALYPVYVCGEAYNHGTFSLARGVEEGLISVTEAMPHVN